MKNDIELKKSVGNLEQLDALSLKRRAAEDAVKDADSYAFGARPQRKKATEPKSVEPILDLLSGRHARIRVGAQDGIDGLLIHANEDGPRLVLSDELMEISIADEVEALDAEPITIFHVQAPAPWVEHAYVGKA